MANTSKGRFPSYGLVRGPSHADGGVPASVANGPDVELEGGEYIIPKEAVPDYLPVLQQITQVGRDRQQMQNGNTAIDALIASASMQNGIAQPKSPVYQEGGRVSFLERLPLIGNQLRGYREFQEAEDFINRQNPDSPLFSEEVQQRGIQAGGEFKNVKKSENDKTVMDLVQSAMYNYDPQELSRGIASFGKSDQGKSVLNKLLIGRPEGYTIEEDDGRASRFVGRENIAQSERGKKLLGLFPVGYSGSVEPNTEGNYQLDFSDLDALKALAGYQQGGMVQYEDGGEVHSRRMYNQGTGFNKKKSDLDGDGKISEYERKRGMAIAKAMGKMQEGGQVYADKKPIPYSAGRKDYLYGSGKSAEQQRDIIAQRYIYPADDDMIFRPSAGPASGIGALKGYGLNLLLNSLTGGATGGYNALAAGLGAVREIRKMGSDKTQVKRMAEGKQPFDPVHFAKDYESGDVYSATRKGWRKLDPKTVSNIEENFPDYMKNLEAFNTGFKYRQEQGGPINNYQMGGMVGMQRPMNPAMNFSPMQRMNPRMYQEGGQVQPRKQQEMRNSNMFIGPPRSLMGPGLSNFEKAEKEFEAFMDSLEYRRSLNPFTGEPMDTDADVKRLLERMKKSKIPPSRQRMPMQEGGQVKASDMGLRNFGEVTSMPSGSVSRPEFEAFMNYAATEEEAEETRRKQMENFMSMLGSDKRILPPDKYTTRIADEDGMMIMSETEIPKLSTAYMSSFGFATPLSKRQGALLQRKMIAPETLNPSVKGLINRVLVQRLGNENN